MGNSDPRTKVDVAAFRPGDCVIADDGVQTAEAGDVRFTLEFPLPGEPRPQVVNIIIPDSDAEELGRRLILAAREARELKAGQVGG